MKPRSVGRRMLATIFVALLASSATGYSQQDTGNTADAFTARLMQGVIDPPPSLEELSAFLTRKIEAECSAVMLASPDELQKEERWLSTLTRDAKARYEVSLTKLGQHVTARGADGDDMFMWKEGAESARNEASEAYLEMKIVGLFTAEVGKCIEMRKPAVQGQKWARGSWGVRCNEVPGITPDEGGRIELQLHPDYSVTATVYPTDSQVGVEVGGQLLPTGDFVLIPTVDRGNLKIEVDGKINSASPLTASGTIEIVNVVEEYGTSRCSGTWDAR